MSTWISSDWHLGHKNIVLGLTEWEGEERRKACRDFETLAEHDSVILDNINSNVKKDDFIYFLGDFSFGGSDNIYKYRSKIVCENIHFIMGNHDYHIRKNKIVKTPQGHINAQNLFLTCSDILEKKIGRDNFVFCHYPIHSFHKMHGGAVHCYGHIHEGIDYNPQAVCVTIDSHKEFRPYHIDEVRKIIKDGI